MSFNPRQLQRSFAGGEMAPHMFGRPDDAKLINGAALLQNYLPHPTGAISRRPGTRLVRATKDAAQKSHLFPFVFSNNQSAVVEASRATVSAREIGHFRFHVNGGTLLFSKPADYVGPLGLTSAVLPGTDTFTATGHGLSDGDPVVFTMLADASSTLLAAVSFPSRTTSQDQYVDIGALTTLAAGSEVMFDANGGTIPSTVEEGRVYYLTSNPAGTNWTFSKTYNGRNVKGSGTGSTGQQRVSAMPRVATEFGIHRVYYAIETGANTFQVAATRAEAIGGSPVPINLTHAGELGTATIRVHRHYERGDLVSFGSPALRYYCMKEAWGFYPNPYARAEVFTDDHQGHAPTDKAYWYELPGDYEDTTGTLAFDFNTDTVTWTTHGLSNGETVLFDGADLPLGLTAGTVYYVRNAATNTFQVSLSAAGAVVTFSDNGTGTRGALAGSVYEVPHYYSQADLERLSFAQSNDVVTFTTFDKPVAELRRLSASKWVFDHVTFLAGASTPDAPRLQEANPGEGDAVTATSAATPGTLTLDAAHAFAAGDPSYCTGLLGAGIADGFYVVQAVPTSTTLQLKEFETGLDVTTSSTSPTAGRIRYVSSVGELSHTYAITSVDANGEESSPSESLTIDNVLLVNGSFNLFAWEPAAGAVRYRVYKQRNGLYGFIGETEDTSFKDEDIDPDLNISPPMLDGSLRVTRLVDTFDAVEDYVLVSGHVVTEGMAMVFHTNNALPTGMEVGKTYYALNVEDGRFQLSETPGGTAFNIGSAGSGRSWLMHGHFPDTVAYFEQRRWFAGARTLPQNVWATASGTEGDLSYAIPIVDSDRISVKIAAREGSAVRHLVPLSQLLLLSDTVEYRLTPINDDAVTPSSISIRPQSWVGADIPQPSIVNNSVVFIAARGGHVRELGYSQDVLGYLTGDLAIRTSHLFDGFTISKTAYQKAPVPTIWFISSSNKLLSLTYIPEENVGAWAQHVTDGTFESIAVVPEGAEDAVYVTVLRNGVRYVERMGDHFRPSLATVNDARLDSALTYAGAPITLVQGLEHLESKTVGVVADGVYTTKVVTGGSITLTTAASTITVGLPFTSQVDSVPLYMQFGNAFSSGRQKNVSDVFLRLYNSGTFEAGPLGGRYSTSRDPASGTLLTGVEKVKIAGNWDDNAQVSVRKTDGLPQTIVALVLEIATGG